MSIFKDSYHTTVGSIFITTNIIDAIKESIIKQGGVTRLDVKDSNGITPGFITGILDNESDIPLFTHPISIYNFQKKNYLFTDLRLFIKKDSSIGDIDKGIKNLTEYNFAKSRAILNLLWLSDGTTQIKNSLSFAGIVFASWLSEAISKIYALDFKDQTTVAIITSYYYQSLFNEESTFDEDTKQKMAIHTIKAVKAPSDFIFKIFDMITPINDVNDYCKNISTIVENVRLKDFNLAVLLTIVKNSWYGANAKEIMSVAIEHPPTWIAIVYTAINERTYKNSTIYRIAERYGKNGGAVEFNRNYLNMIKNELSIATELLTFENFQ